MSVDLDQLRDLVEDESADPWDSVEALPPLIAEVAKLRHERDKLRAALERSQTALYDAMHAAARLTAEDIITLQGLAAHAALDASTPERRERFERAYAALDWLVTEAKP